MVEIPTVISLNMAPFKSIVFAVLALCAAMFVYRKLSKNLNK